jgi:hypothetical protein
MLRLIHFQSGNLPIVLSAVFLAIQHPVGRFLRNDSFHCEQLWQRDIDK